MKNSARLGFPSNDLDLNACSFTKTGHRYERQYWKRCLDCSTRSNVGACLNCIAVCHAGHRIDPTLRDSEFFCDCGATGCKLTRGVVGAAPIRPLDPPSFGWIPYNGLESDVFFRVGEGEK